jgi:hypothetical protein
VGVVLSILYVEDDELLLLYRAGVDEQLISNFNILQGNQRNAPHPPTPLMLNKELKMKFE